MSLFIKLFETTAEYNAYTADTENFIKPNVSCTLDDLTNVHYNPYVPETRVVAKLNVTDTSSPTQICGYDKGTPPFKPPKDYSSGFTSIEIDGVILPSVSYQYQFDTIGEHTVKYTLLDPTTIGEYAFYGCSGFTSISIPNSVTSIGERAFYQCSSLTSIDIPSGVTSIGIYAFNRCSSLTSMTIPNSVTSIGYGAFNRCSSLTSIDIPNNVTSIGDNTFSNCSNLTSCTIGSGVTSIESSVFSGCTSLTSIEIPSGVTSIGTYAFNGCSGLTSATVRATTPPTLSTYCFDNNASGRKIYVPAASVDAYKAATNWSTYASDIEPIS